MISQSSISKFEACILAPKQGERKFSYIFGPKFHVLSNIGPIVRKTRKSAKVILKCMFRKKFKAIENYFFRNSVASFLDANSAPFFGIFADLFGIFSDCAKKSAVKSSYSLVRSETLLLRRSARFYHVPLWYLLLCTNFARFFAKNGPFFGPILQNRAHD